MLLVLTAAGAVIGSYLAGGRNGTGGGNLPSNTSPAISPTPTSTSTQRGGLGPFPGPGPGPGGNGPPGTGGRPPPPPPGVPRPHIKITRSYNGHYTVFTVRGWQWRPGLVVTVTLLDVGTALLHPTVDAAGNFTFVLNGPHSYFHGKLSLTGTYQVIVRGPGGATAVAPLRVYRA